MTRYTGVVALIVCAAPAAAQDADAWRAQFLQQAWDEDIEALMISFAAFDSAFDEISDSRQFRRVMGLAAEMELSVESLGGSVHLIRGAGSNVIAQVGADGLLLIDTGYAPALPALRRALSALGGGRVTRLILTHPHEDHMGSAAALGDAATVLAHPGTTEAMREPYVFMEGVELPPKAQSAYPDAEIASDTAFVSNGEEVRIAVTPAHTGADLVVYFTESRVARFGDTYLGGNPMMFPGNEDADAYLDKLEALLDSMHPETVVVGGHDDPVGLDAVRAQIEVSRACMALVRTALEDGLTVEQTAERGADFPPQWVAFFYRLLSTS